MATPAVLTYVYIRGKWYAFPDTDAAREAVVKYNGNQPDFLNSKTTYTHAEILVEMAKSDWTENE